MFPSRSLKETKKPVNLAVCHSFSLPWDAQEVSNKPESATVEQVRPFFVKFLSRAITDNSLFIRNTGTSLRESDLDRIRMTYIISDEYEMHAPCPNDRPHQPRDGELCIYERVLKCVLRFPLVDNLFQICSLSLSFECLACHDRFSFFVSYPRYLLFSKSF